MNRNHVEIWNKCLAVIRENIPAISFKTWFEPIVPIKLEGVVLTIQVPSPFFYEYLEEQFIDILRKALRLHLGYGAKLDYHVKMDHTSLQSKTAQNVNIEVPTTAMPVSQAKAVVPTPEKSNNRPPLANRQRTASANDKDQSIKNPFVIPGIRKIQIDPQLNSTNNFQNFIEGDCNKLARSAGFAIAKNPGGTAFNPLVIYGNSGLGKTHVAQAVGNEVKVNFPEKTVLYVSANKFMTQFSEATKNNNRNDFLHFYQMIDVLIIDDIQELAGREKTQLAFFHVFNHLHQNKKQLILTSDKPPVELKGMEERLLTRFKWGLTADITEPNYDTRVAILKQKALMNGLNLEDSVVEYIANNVKNNVRELEGAIISLLAQSTLNNKNIDVSLANDAISKLVKQAKKEYSIPAITKVVCDYFKMKPDQLQAKTRKREIVQARQIAMYFAKSLTDSSLSSIGAQIGKKDHATVLHACKTIGNLKETDKKFQKYLSEIESQIRV
ncbi:chromosomal replication initiator protein DnaA [Halosquirtibacter xylanolyticus]|uniref:chromosomal replication initiator protein DnaA n=1 Tax=Halosquirtibacter xylanolyticus TaxID=3374599 RepID=UPI003749B4F7|nr:chromosomal replication initiator protein DnaA [Prolixibacteraceae bacterium]